MHWLTGSDLTESVWDDFFAFYMETGSRKWGGRYLTRAFYSIIGETMADKVLLVMARRAGRYIAGAINFIGGDALYGRHWGAVEHHPFLHFELCYYQAIDYAIQNKLTRVEAGAQGEHKLARGYMPVTTYSAHYIADAGLRRAIADYLKREAKRELDAASRTYAAALGVRVKRVSIRDQSSRWGSCTAAGVLSYSWRLILAPPHVLDYLAAHEVAHLVEMNHSRKFWRVVERICPDFDLD